jgi:hypothetical protein
MGSPGTQGKNNQPGTRSTPSPAYRVRGVPPIATWRLPLSILAHPWPPGAHPRPHPPTRTYTFGTQLVGAQLTQLVSLSLTGHGVCGPEMIKEDVHGGPYGRPVPASELLGGLPALSRLTRLTSLTVDVAPGAGGPQGRGAPAGDVLRALPHGSPLKQVGCGDWIGGRAGGQLAGVQAVVADAAAALSLLNVRTGWAISFAPLFYESIQDKPLLHSYWASLALNCAG